MSEFDADGIVEADDDVVLGGSDDPYRFWLGLLAVGARRCLAWAWRF